MSFGSEDCGMQRDESTAFLANLLDCLRGEAPGRAAFIEMLRRFRIPILTEELRQRCAQCKTPVESLIPLRREVVWTSPHDYSTCDSWLCWCPTLSTLVLKSRSLFASRTHGHHFREKWWTSFRLLSEEEAWGLVVAAPDAVADALATRTKG